MIEKIVPRNVTVFGPGRTIRFEIPLLKFFNPGKLLLDFEITLHGQYGAAVRPSALFLKNIRSAIFSKARLLYGSRPIEECIPKHFFGYLHLSEWSDGTFVNESVHFRFPLEHLGMIDWPTTVDLSQCPDQMVIEIILENVVGYRHPTPNPPLTLQRVYSYCVSNVSLVYGSV